MCTKSIKERSELDYWWENVIWLAKHLSTTSMCVSSSANKASLNWWSERSIKNQQQQQQSTRRQCRIKNLSDHMSWTIFYRRDNIVIGRFMCCMDFFFISDQLFDFPFFYVNFATISYAYFTDFVLFVTPLGWFEIS